MNSTTFTLNSLTTLQVTNTAEATEVAIAGELDWSCTDRLRRHLHDELRLLPRALILDLDAVTFCSAHSIRVLVDTALHARAADIPYVISRRSQVVQRLIKLLKLELILPFHSTAAGARGAVQPP
ncbi:STAS domain-containing protein [Amycolatopsis magusensis]|uniref:Anti-anti-sigma factor n=1 Tax=Amycolatopsis magusensis TaxID=882444 RepID=A0ABS4Q1P4_9PSEU|nr:STAS domain-containing protein [Amycolatopsis magusensis]MBP2185598.1 anti-anti-sigma factor [Amycolatopsis magusensis]MDI5980689.1 STAS domain-containing protein [Amycolatopsis magusensis]